MAEKTDESAKVVIAKKRLSKRQIIILVCILVVLVGGGVGAWLKFHHKKTYDVPQLDAPALANAVSKDLGQRHFADAIKLVQGQKTINETSTQLLLATVYTAKNDYVAALKIYATLDKAGKLAYDSLAAAGAVAETAGNNSAALNYYKEAVQKAQTTKNLPNADVVPMYQGKIAELEKKVSK